MEETFRLEIAADRGIVLPKRLLAAADIKAGDEVRFVTDQGKIKSIQVIARDQNQNVPSEGEDKITLSRLEEIRAGNHEDSAQLSEELSKPSRMVAW